MRKIVSNGTTREVINPKLVQANVLNDFESVSKMLKMKCVRTGNDAFDWKANREYFMRQKDGVVFTDNEIACNDCFEQLQKADSYKIGFVVGTALGIAGEKDFKVALKGSCMCDFCS